jgi:hypothetical protein
MDEVYDVRSRVVHGEQIPDAEAATIAGRLQRLSGAVVVAAADQMMAQGLAPANLDAVRKEWRQQ